MRPRKGLGNPSEPSTGMPSSRSAVTTSAHSGSRPQHAQIVLRTRFWAEVGARDMMYVVPERWNQTERISPDLRDPEAAAQAGSHVSEFPSNLLITRRSPMQKNAPLLSLAAG
jgi:hypothetical protein